MIGIVDLILERKEDDKIILVDHKSSGHFFKKDGTPLKSSEESFLGYRRQMYMYADAMKNSKEFGCFPDYIVWDHFLDEGKLSIIPFKKEEFDESIKWVKDTIKKIYKDAEFAPCLSYMRCHTLCNYRDGYCEYQMMGGDDEEG